MDTPVINYVNLYDQSKFIRMHMPGHKGKVILGYETKDITEIYGAGDLYSAEGPIGIGENNSAKLFGTLKTCWVTEGSSQCIRAMLALAALHNKERSQKILAARNAHRAFITGCALLDLDIEWLWPQSRDYSLCSCPVTAEQIEKAICQEKKPPIAVWLTSPDYLGGMQDIRSVAEICHRYHVPLLVDNAHGAYLKFLNPSMHPIDLGADMCCDSAHKTLPALTGCAYLHISKTSPAVFASEAKRMLALFGSTSPSWLMLQSLDEVNRVLDDAFPVQLYGFIRNIADMKVRLAKKGWHFFGDEPSKITIDSMASGYSGPELAAQLRKQDIECEYADPDFLVLMPSLRNTPEEMKKLEDVLSQIPVLPAIPKKNFPIRPLEKVLNVREAMLAVGERLPIENAVGKVLVEGALTCPPAVAAIVAGERISLDILPIMKYYGIDEVLVLPDN